MTTASSYDDYGMPVGAYSDPESLTHQAYRVARAFIVYRAKPFIYKILGIRSGGGGGPWNWKSIFSLGRLLVLIWVVVVWQFERGAFRGSGVIDGCSWEGWEKWVRIRMKHAHNEEGMLIFWF